MGNRLTILERVRQGHVTLDELESNIRSLVDSEVNRHSVLGPNDSEYYVGILNGKGLFVEFELTNVRPDVIEGKTYTEYIKILIDITDKDTEYFEDIAEDLAKVIRQFTVHGMLSSALEHRFYSYYGENVLIQVKQPELDIRGVRK